jgi:hypothetical protein
MEKLGANMFTVHGSLLNDWWVVVNVWPPEYSGGHKFTTTVLLYEYMDQYCKHNGIPLSAHFIYLNLDSIWA